ncbi:Vms1/Ankzf1 family peptidyl-tRNA hydrolase [Natronolimnohabitans innermongolicus]|uniref:Peptide chain release factor 1 n=1 Tax=Natronolimnohabitans innermongolicus JCM 12255 TaxID=1227499 RepID=L9WUY0_9EURY|nr:Vms1/Ankzf1 family peptidyl-tRNA hydrolase [Natronolimnohabitans innermongolicus]ELY53299.1 peptide chain release factor 1 [Natronolimnohabitans innermongolicus JCM 12255]
MSSSSYELHERLDRLSSASADRDVLVTLAVPPDETIGEARQPVETDYAEGSQLDEQSFPKPLTDALETVRSTLNEYDEIPEHGLAIYAGAPDGDLLTVVFDDLPVPIKESTYRHANEFDLGPLQDVTEPESTHGLLVVERGGAALGRLDGQGVDVVDTFDSNVPGKSSAGGQSAERFERDRERQKREFFDEVAERARRAFVDDDPVDSVLLGGTTGTIETFREEADLDHRLEDRLTGEFAVEYATQQGLEQLAEKGQEALEERDREDVTETLSAFFDRVGDGEEPVAYGREEIDDALEFDAVETLLLSTELEADDLQELGDRTEQQGGETVVVPDDFPDGSRFAEAFDGVGALLRFPID